MRKINPGNFGVARRGTAREINRRIVLTLIAAHQPISRADLARIMKTNRASITLMVNRMIEEGLIVEGEAGQIARGRKPRLLQLNMRRSCVVAVDIRPTSTHMTLTDLLGNPITDIRVWPTERDIHRFIRHLTGQIKKLLAHDAIHRTCAGVGVVVPGIVDADGQVVLAPHLGWRDIPLAKTLATKLGLQVKIENSGRACALAQVWMTRKELHPCDDLVYVSVSDGVGVGIVIHGELVRGRRDSAGQFAHIPLNIDGPRCFCGASGCWEAYVSNLATLERYWGAGSASSTLARDRSLPDLIGRARSGDGRALATLLSTGRYLGIGFAAIVSAIDPACICVGGEITAAWDLIGETVHEAVQERILGHKIPPDLIRLVSPTDYPRIRGAAVLITAPAFAAPRIA
jgi:predicted NBD/HSP70 family sugar kinase